MDNIIIKVTESLKSVNDTLEEYISSGEITYEHKLVFVRFWVDHASTNKAIDYAQEVVNADVQSLYEDAKALQEEIKRHFEIHSSNERMYMAIKFNDNPHSSHTSNAIERAWEVIDMDIFDYLIKRYDLISKAIMNDIVNYWKENNIIQKDDSF